MLFWEGFENSNNAMVILALFELLLRKFCLVFLSLILMYFTNKDIFCSHISIYACLRRLLSKKYEVMEKLYSLKTLLKMAGGGVHPSLDLPLIMVIITI